MPADRISKLLEDIRLLDSERFELVQKLREIILGLDSCVSEEVKYGGFFEPPWVLRRLLLLRE